MVYLCIIKRALISENLEEWDSRYCQFFQVAKKARYEVLLNLLPVYREEHSRSRFPEMWEAGI